MNMVPDDIIQTEPNLALPVPKILVNRKCCLFKSSLGVIVNCKLPVTESILIGTNLGSTFLGWLSLPLSLSSYNFLYPLIFSWEHHLFGLEAYQWASTGAENYGTNHGRGWGVGSALSCPAVSPSLPPIWEFSLCVSGSVLSYHHLCLSPLTSDSSHLSTRSFTYPGLLREKGPGRPDSLTLDVERIELLFILF